MHGHGQMGMQLLLLILTDACCKFVSCSLAWLRGYTVLEIYDDNTITRVGYYYVVVTTVI
jgi:hypothetical protein